MADPWAEFRLPESNAANLVRNDAPAIEAPRAPVPATSRVWGDKEAEAAGLYEQPGGADPWAAFRVKAQQQAAPQPAQKPPYEMTPEGRLRVNIGVPIQERSDLGREPQNADALRKGLEARAAQMTTGPEVSPTARMATEQANILPALSQGTNPNIDLYNGKLISTQAYEGDDGGISFVDPQTGDLVRTDSSKHVAIRDPRDGVVKIFQRTEDTNESPVVGVSRVMAQGLGAGAPTARPSIPTPGAKAATPRASDIFSTSKPYYRAFEKEAGAIDVPAESAAGMGDRLRRSLDKAHLIPELAPPVYSAIGILDKGGVPTLDALQGVKRVVGRSFSSPDKNIRDAAAVASAEIGKMISEVSKSAGKNLKTADAIHSAARGVQELQRKGEIAGLRTGSAGYGGNAVNNMRQVLKPIVQRAIEGKTTSFKPDEIAAIREFVEGTPLINTLRAFGQLSPSKGIIQTGAGLIAAGTGALTMGPAGIAIAAGIPALGMASNKVAAILTAKQLGRLQELVAKRSPEYAAAVAKAMDRYVKAQEAFANKPTPDKFAGYLSASRALSSGFQRDGIQITSGDLLRALSGPPQKAAADEQQEPAPGVQGQ